MLCVGLAEYRLMHDGITIKNSPGKGRGVFADKDFQEGDVIEISHVTVVPQVDEINKTDLQWYVFTWGLQEELYAIAHGYGSLYNHSYQPNAQYKKFQYDKIILFTAIKSIKIGEEIFVNYNGEPDCQDEVMHVKF